MSIYYCPLHFTGEKNGGLERLTFKFLHSEVKLLNLNLDPGTLMLYRGPQILLQSVVGDTPVFSNSDREGSGQCCL